MPGKFLNEITADKPAKDDLGLFFDKSKNTTAQSSLVDIVAAGLDITSGKAGEAPVVIETVNPDGTKTQTLGWGKTGSSAGSAPPRPANATDLIITHDPASGTDGAATPAQVLTAGLPAGGTAGDALTLTASGLAWGSSLPASTTADKGKQLTVQADGKVAWSADSSDLPAFTGADTDKRLVVVADTSGTVPAPPPHLEWKAPELPTLTAGLDALQIKADKSGVEWTSSVNMSTNLKGGYTAGAFFPVNDQKTNTTRFVDASEFRKLAGVPELMYFPGWTPTNDQINAGWNDMGVALARMVSVASSDTLAGKGAVTKTAAGFPGNYAFSAGVVTATSKVVLIPFYSTSIMLYDYVTNSISTSAATGTFQPEKFYGGVLLANGKVFFTPHKALNPIIYDPDTDSVKVSAAVFPGGEGHYGATLMGNGKVLCVPYTSTQLKIYDPVTDSVVNHAAPFPGSKSYAVCQLLPNGNVFMPPCVTTGVLKAKIYNPTTDTVTDSAAVFGSGAGYNRCILIQDGRVVLLPTGAGRIAVYNPVTDSLTESTALPVVANQFHGGSLLPNGKVFLAPYSSTSAMVYDPIKDTVERSTALYPGAYGYFGSVLLPNGRVLCIPMQATQAALVDFSSQYVGTLSNNLILSPFYNRF